MPLNDGEDIHALAFQPPDQSKRMKPNASRVKYTFIVLGKNRGSPKMGRVFTIGS